MLTVSEVLHRKGSEVLCVTPDTPVRDANRMMVERNIGALVVRTSTLPAGIFSEHDYVREMASRGPSILDLPVRETMKTNIPWVWPTDNVVTCMNLMTIHRVRHLPVVDRLRLCGVVSMGDIVAELIADQGAELRALQEYVLRLR